MTWLYIQFSISLAFNFLLLNLQRVYIIIKMPRTKQLPRKNPRDIPNPTNWASNLRNNHCKYFYLIYALGCDRMVIFCSRMGIFCGWMGLSHHNLSTFALYFMSLFYPTLQSDGYSLCLDGYILRSDSYSLCSDVDPRRIFNFTFFLFLNSCQQHSSGSIWGPPCPTSTCTGGS